MLKYLADDAECM